MTDYVNNRKFYTANNAFLSGTGIYTGYVLRRDQDYTDLNGNTVEKASTFSTDLASSDFFRDRLVTDTLSIPHPLSSVQIKVNDIVTNSLINDKFNLLHENSIYLYKSLQMPNNYLPTSTNTRFAAMSASSEFAWFDTYADLLEYPDTIYPNFASIDHGIGVTSFHNTSIFSMFCTTSSSFIALTGSTSTLQVTEQSTYIEQSDNQHEFRNLTSMDYDNGLIYLCDEGADTIYKYDITSYLKGDTGFYNNRVLVETVGSKGGADDSTRFDSPTLVAVTSDRVAVYDSGNAVIKIFDQDFNFISKVTVGTLSTEPAVAMRYNKFTDELYVITITTSSTLRLYRVQRDLTVDDVINLVEVIDEDEVVKEISFSTNDSNYWYLVTNARIYKKLVNKPEGSIGSYDDGKLFLLYTYIWNYAVLTWDSAELLWNSISNKSSATGNFIGITCEQSNANVDTIFMFKYGRFYRYNELNDYINLLDFYNAPNYSLEDISLSTKEFIQPVVYNKEIYKLMFNLLNLKNNIIGRYHGVYDVQANFRISGYDYTIDLSKFEIRDINNFILHQNEGINYYSVNRTLTQICNLQQILLDAVRIELSGLIPYPLTSNTLIVD